MHAYCDLIKSYMRKEREKKPTLLIQIAHTWQYLDKQFLSLSIFSNQSSNGLLVTLTEVYQNLSTEILCVIFIILTTTNIGCMCRHLTFNEFRSIKSLKAATRCGPARDWNSTDWMNRTHWNDFIWLLFWTFWHLVLFMHQVGCMAGRWRPKRATGTMQDWEEHAYCRMVYDAVHKAQPQMHRQSMRNNNNKKETHLTEPHRLMLLVSSAVASGRYVFFTFASVLAVDCATMVAGIVLAKLLVCAMCVNCVCVCVGVSGERVRVCGVGVVLMSLC